MNRKPIHTAALGAAFFVSACLARPVDDPDPELRLYALKAGYEIALDQVLAYADQPPCGAETFVACADGDIVRRLYRHAAEADAALDAAERAVRADPPHPFPQAHPSSRPDGPRLP
ncbi:MAG: hypothetical protein ACTS3R_07860, partial [Inquilinaceae bacterium]